MIGGAIDDRGISTNPDGMSRTARCSKSDPVAHSTRGRLEPSLDESTIGQFDRGKCEQGEVVDLALDLAVVVFQETDGCGHDLGKISDSSLCGDEQFG